MRFVVVLSVLTCWVPFAGVGFSIIAFLASLAYGRILLVVAAASLIASIPLTILFVWFDWSPILLTV